MPAKPGFGTPKQEPSYYRDVSQIIATLRPFSSLTTICKHLTGQGFLSPAGLEWTKHRLANFIRGKQYKPTTN
jgi:hypothetical protein